MPVISTIAAATARAFGAFKSAAGGAVDEFFDYVTLLLHGDGTNGAQNNTFLDSSTNNFTITRNGNTTQGTFSPFSQTGWSNYFDGSGDYLSTPSSITLGSGNLTIEGWAYPTNTSGGVWCDFRGPDSGSAANNPVIQWSTVTASKFTVRIDGTNAITSSSTFSINNWHHVALVRSGTTVTLYVNGTSQGTYTTSTSFAQAYVRIGAYGGDGSVAFTGYASNLRAVIGTAIYTATFTPPTTPLTAVSGTALLTCQSNRFIDNSTNNFTITVNGNTSVQAFSPFAPTAAYSAATVGGSGYFDGSGDDLTTPSNAAFTYGTGDFCVECWCYFTGGVGGSGYSYVFGQGASTGSSSLGLYIQGGVYKVWNGSAVITGTATFAQNTWVHLAITRSGTTLRLFVNGIQDGSATNSNSISTGTTTGISIGRWSEVADTNYITGYVSNFRVVKGSAVYTSAFTPPTAPLTAISGTSLLTNFTNGGIIDNTAKNVLETVGNAQISTSVKKFGTGSLAFDGTGDNLLIPDTVNLDFGTGNMTIEFWLYRNNTTDDMAVIDARSGASTGWLIYLGSGNKIIWFVSAGVITGSTTIGSGSWYHIAITKSGTTHRLFVNGVQDGTATNSTSADAGIVSIGSKSPGASSSSIVNLNGYIDDLRITKGIARYTANFTPQTSQWQDQ